MSACCVVTKKNVIRSVFYRKKGASIEGFSLIELLVVTVIIAFLSALAVPNFIKILAKAKRAEAYMYLRTFAQAQKVYYAEHGSYTTNLTALGWKPEGSFVYTYGFPGGAEGESYVIGHSGAPSSALQGASVSSKGFIIRAAGAIYGEKLDIISLDQAHRFTVVSDALS
ncbi:prepilin-type N-terminal cleavage/methylation domain-containing protein [Candidatus Dependentiae bacterium]|nr:prepilin-type N-terminal cleavage/methylation domain-containing protein [Candidatus Dependentiae bacterium]